MKENKTVEIENTEEVTEMKESKFEKIGNKFKNFNIKNAAKAVGLTMVGVILGVVGYKLIEDHANADSDVDDYEEVFDEDVEEPEE